jgi:peptidoglycan/LPS O-acetylase OafA/YrhL
MVLGSHVLAGWDFTSEAQQVPKLLGTIVGHGWLGVDLFFVLSGFLITGILLDSKERPSYFRNFYARRFLRIIPLYFTVIGVMWLCYGGPAQYFLLSLTFLANFSMAFGVECPHGAGVFWSLAVEEHFYLIWPCLVRFLSRRLLTIFALSVVIGVPFLRLWAQRKGMDPNAIYSYSYFRFDGLALGALLAIWVRSRYANRRTSLRMAAALVGVSLLLTLVGLPFGIMALHSVFRFTQAELVFAGFILASITLRGSALTSPLRWRFSKLSGDLSYCIYLIHLAVGDGCEYLLSIAGFPFGLRRMLVRGVLMLTVTFAIAWLSHGYFEGPILRLKRYFEYAGAEPRRATPASAPV